MGKSQKHYAEQKKHEKLAKNPLLKINGYAKFLQDL